MSSRAENLSFIRTSQKSKSSYLLKSKGKKIINAAFVVRLSTYLTYLTNQIYRVEMGC